MIVAIDIGGTKTLIASFSYDGKIQKETKFPTPQDKDEFVNSLKTTLLNEYNYEPIEVIAIAIPGVIENNIISRCAHLPWKNFDIISSLKEIMNDVPIIIENDANLGGLGEVSLLKTTPVSATYITISTGIGSGIISNGKIDIGTDKSEVGHALLEYKGKYEEWEKFAAGSAIVATYGKYARDIKDPVIWDEIADRISRGFLVLIPILQPECIIIGGSIGTYYENYIDKLNQIIKERLSPYISVPKILKAQHPEESVIYGCYYYGFNSISDTVTE